MIGGQCIIMAFFGYRSRVHKGIPGVLEYYRVCKGIEDVLQYTRCTIEYYRVCKGIENVLEYSRCTIEYTGYIRVWSA